LGGAANSTSLAKTKIRGKFWTKFFATLSSSQAGFSLIVANINFQVRNFIASRFGNEITNRIAIAAYKCAAQAFCKGRRCDSLLHGQAASKQDPHDS